MDRATADERQRVNDRNRQKAMGTGMGLGLVFGAALGLIWDDMALGMAIGVALGAGIGASMTAKAKQSEDEDIDGASTVEQENPGESSRH